MKNTIRIFMISVALSALLIVLAGKSFAGDDDIVVPPPSVKIESPDTRPRTVEIIIKDHRFEPSEMTLFPQEKIILRVTNKDESAEEFESHYLKREKIVPGKSSVDIAVGPLKPGVYEFVGEYHEDTARGKITVPQLGWNYNNQK